MNKHTTPRTIELTILRGEGNLGLVLDADTSIADAERVAEWIAERSGYTVILDTCAPVRQGVGPDGKWFSSDGLSEDKPLTPPEKTYVIFHDDYMCTTGMNAYQFKGTWRQLLEYLNNITDENRDEPFEYALSPDRDNVIMTTARQVSDEDLVKLFDQANGDGQPYYVVWCVEDERVVLGGVTR